jgi:hypothetical protein
MICFNYNKPGYFLSIFLEPHQKNLKEIKKKESDKPEKGNKSGKRESQDNTPA